ncbi:TPA: cheVAW transcriptional regulator CheP [Campylobacter jejuni]|uniref:cheVAW transcriptional regulator CheP n=1 Tax=Campylobacter sp. CH278 TaxID=2498132 RepID=UPI001068D2AD|nr:cheVAW transcriptional regulator CheP [Campylobacter sp. CH278]HDZ4240881.1 cheVAW transcriptional regulator CheP [Campylobacter jejuni]TEX83499.1 HDOD domain-containing protein [Campylobacter sp. CH278]HDZ4253077.1 cheVAW transcriptional regulator CheP [Campylobacter jejuni]HDZ4262727.1 cheVAW transcriptional regulator CheP [Campylobacter jejuni]HDZ4283469.1 cheVAW transcriptional regulator CheP [Campylobacter jejuni]
MDMNELLLKSVEVLPPLPDTVSKLRKYVSEANSNIETMKVTEIISSDPLMTAKLLQLANSPYYGFTREITTINQVITLLGVGNIINIVTADSIRDNFKIDVSPYGLNTQNFLKTCNEEATFITNWLNDEDKKLSHLLVPCAMLLRLGIVIFSNFLIQNHKDKDFLAFLNKNENLALAENEFLGVDHISFLGFLLHRWNFDDVLIESICFVRTPHAAREEVKKSAYALAITDHLFAPHDGSSPFNAKAAVALLEEAKTQGINFDLNNLLSKLPSKAKENLNKED